jgi:hypothetical protein
MGLLRYSPWQLRDYAIDKAIPTAAVAALTAYLNYAPVMLQHDVLRDGAPSPLLLSALANTLVAVVLVAALFATNGIVGDDRRLGYYQILFSKPVRVPWFYAQKFAVSLIGFVLVLLILLAIHALVVTPLLPLALLPVAALLFVSVGGIGFLASALWRYDWATLTAVLFASAVVWDRWGAAPGWLRWIPRLFPPIDHIGAIAAAAAGGTELPMTYAVWLMAYGVVCFVLGLAILTRRRLTA